MSKRVFSKKVLTGVLLWIPLISPPIAVGKDMPLGKWWHNPRVSEQLNLSEEEKSTLDALFVESRRKLIDLKSSVEREQFELENLLESKVLDEAAVMEQFKRLEKARGNLSTERFNFIPGVRKTIGFERFQRLKMFHQKLRRYWKRRTMEGLSLKK
jgi:uncharacterized membrane protein